MKKDNKDGNKLAALLKSKAPGAAAQAVRLTPKTGVVSNSKYMRLNLSFYQSDGDKIRDIIVKAAQVANVTFNSSQALRYAIRHCRLDEATAADFAAILNEDARRTRQVEVR